jgi:hypothetical protein
VNKLKILLTLALAAASIAGDCAAQAKQSFYTRFRSHNAALTALQPTWMGPLIQSDARLSQALRISASSSYWSTHTISYGNNHGLSIIALRRFQIDLDPPSYFRNHSPALKDGFGNAGTQVKFRIASGNAEHGDFALTAILYRSFTPRSYQNDMLTGAYYPKLAAGKAFGRFNVQSTLDGLLPTGKIAEQGRTIDWNMTGQAHLAAPLWFDVENNATFNFAGEYDGKTQNFVTPAAFYLVRRKDWDPTHPVVIFNTGMQIATSRFHCYNHNLVSEMRIVF